MDTENYVVLRSGAGGFEDILGGTRGIGLEATDAEVTLERETLTDGDVVEMQRERGVLGVAPLMPVTLVAPLAASADGAADTGPVAWGIGAVGAARTRFTGRGVKVAVLDTGIDATHEAFRGKTIEVKDFTGEGDGDVNGHGTHCAGTFFGGEVGGVRIGVAPGVENILIGKVLDGSGSGSTAQILDGILWAARSGANVISVSLGLDFPGMVKKLVEGKGFAIEPATSRALAAYRDNLRLFDRLSGLLAAQGAMFSRTIVIAAAGNESRRPAYTIATAPPAAAVGFVSVGAVGPVDGTSRLRPAPFSNTGPVVAAPGVDIRSANVGGGLKTLSGTSMATPHVAGVAAMWLEKLGGANALFAIEEFRSRLVASATTDDIDSESARLDCGAGVVQAPQR